MKVEPLTLFRFSQPHKSLQFMIDRCTAQLQGKHMQCSWKLNGDRTPFENENKVIQLQPSYRLKILSGPICVCSWLTFLLARNDVFAFCHSDCFVELTIAAVDRPPRSKQGRQDERSLQTCMRRKQRSTRDTIRRQRVIAVTPRVSLRATVQEVHL